MQRHALFTSAYFKGYAGSEIAVLEQVIALTNRGWYVSVFCLVSGEPLLNHVPSKVDIYTIDNAGEMPNTFDLIIARQYPLLDWLLFTRKITADYIYYEAVGYKFAWDAFPEYYKLLSLTGVVSELTRCELANYGYETSTSYLYPNSAPSAYFEQDIKLPERLEQIAVISNHMPPEIEEFRHIALNAGCVVDLYGKDYAYQLVTPELLSKYNLVISIGKTAYYALASGIPIFMYDVNVSDGYVTQENFFECLSCNFARKDSYISNTADELWERVTHGHTNAVKNAPRLKELASQNFQADYLMDCFLEKIESCSKVDFEKLYSEYSSLRFVGGAFCEEFTRREREYNNIDSYLRKEISQHYKLMQKHAALQQQYDVLLKRYQQIVSSRSWRLLQAVHRLLRLND